MARRARFLAPFALAALSAVAALSLARVVDSGRFALPVLGAALLPHALGALVRRRHWPVWVGVLLAVVGVAVFVLLALEPSTTTLGVPSGDTWRALDRQLTGGWHLLRTAPAPAPATDGAILLAVLAVWCMAAIADWLAFGRQATLAAISPALVFFVWTSTLGTSEWRVLLTVGFCVAAGAFLLAQNLAVLDRRRHWLVSQHPARTRWLAPAALLGGAAVLVALVAAPAIPGAGSDPLLDVANAGRDGSAGHSYRPSLAPFVDIGAKLGDVNDEQLFTVRASQPEYWRIAALDQYTGAGGGQWTLSAQGDGSVQVGLPSDAPGGFEQQFDIGPLGERWLPAAYQPIAINLDDTLVVRSSHTLVADAGDVSRLRYKVVSDLPVAAGTQFDAQQLATMSQPVPAAVRPYTRLTRTPDIDQIQQRAEQIVNDAQATNPYTKAKALRDYFRGSGFVYDTSVDSFDNGSAILQFLNDKHGFCVQFASAYAVMARTLGIPARVAVGFTPGERDANGTFHVSSHDAHAWPEIYLNGLGWTHMFDPTPPRRGVAPAPGGSDLPNETGVAPVTPAPTPATAAPAPPSPGSAGGTAPTAAPTPATPTVAPTVTAPSSDDGLGPWLVVVLVLALFAALVLAYVGAVLTAKHRRRARRRDADDPAVAVAGAWDEALDRLQEASLAPDPAQTPIEVARTVPGAAGAPAARPLHDLARVYSAARYGDAATGPDDAHEAWTSLDDLERALDDGVPWARRWRRRLGLSTFTRR